LRKKLVKCYIWSVLKLWRFGQYFSSALFNWSPSFSVTIVQNFQGISDSRDVYIRYIILYWHYTQYKIIIFNSFGYWQLCMKFILLRNAWC
jgi:hypothetical protein